MLGYIIANRKRGNELCLVSNLGTSEGMGEAEKQAGLIANR